MQKLTAETVFTVLQGKEIALIGLGVSHRPVARLLARKGMNVTVYDKKSPEELGEPARVCLGEGQPGDLLAAGVRSAHGGQLGPPPFERGIGGGIDGRQRTHGLPRALGSGRVRR